MPVFVLVVIFLLGAPGGCSDESVKLDIPDMRSPSELLRGSWEFLGSSVDGVVTPLAEDELFWFFLADNRICALEKVSDGTYRPDFFGIYSATDSTFVIRLSMGDQMKFRYSYSAESDTLQLEYLDPPDHDVRGELLRVFDAPQNERCP